MFLPALCPFPKPRYARANQGKTDGESDQVPCADSEFDYRVGYVVHHLSAIPLIARTGLNRVALHVGVSLLFGPGRGQWLGVD
ncbi:hypothetical protein [Pelagibius sp. Alg239-R121]|uniref:hypothetical protein n=1 Tax=Pelagibius sp. Alg239-R121 TaxID=2993448 RepID=UPI0024A6E56D|nr:hypothetical protein [Pelagibius sp. Alg239-R121]